MSGEIRIGTAGWNYPTGRGTWNGVFYPAPRPRGFDELAYYAEHFDFVEVNSTFYRMPESSLVQRWIERTPPGFLFAVKLFQKFTHPDMYLARAGVTDWNLSAADCDLFRAGIAPLSTAGRLAAVLIQFPPSFQAMPETRDYLDWLFSAFRECPIAVELRHRSWSDEAAETDARLRDAHAAWVLIDEPKFESSIKQELGSLEVGEAGSRGSVDTPVITTRGDAPLAYLRFHGRNRAAWWEHAEAEDRYDYLYSDDELKPFAEAATAAANTGKRVVISFNNHFSAKAVANAAILKEQLGQLVPGDYPREMTARYPELDGVVRTSGLNF